MNHSSSWGELFCVGFLLNSRVLDFRVTAAIRVAVITRFPFGHPESLKLWSSGPEAPTFLGPRAWALGPRGRSLGPGRFFLITLLVGVNCSLLDFCCIVRCKTSKFDGRISVALKIYSNVSRRLFLIWVNCLMLDFCCIVGC